jgi:hypothetical protein
MPFVHKSFVDIVDSMLKAYGITQAERKIWDDLFVQTASHEKLDRMLGQNYITNPDAEVSDSGWEIYHESEDSTSPLTGSSSFKLDKSSGKCICSTQDLMIRGCKCGGN